MPDNSFPALLQAGRVAFEGQRVKDGKPGRASLDEYAAHITAVVNNPLFILKAKRLSYWMNNSRLPEKQVEDAVRAALQL